MRGMTTAADAKARTPLSRDRVFAAAVEIADAEGIDSLTMRALAERLGVEAMSLYYHVANKAALLDGVADVVVGEILAAVTESDSDADVVVGENHGAVTEGDSSAESGTPSGDYDWQTALRRRILTARTVLLRHPWAPALLVRPGAFGPAAVQYFEGVLAILVRGGFSYDLAHHAIHALGSRAIGFAQELFTPADAAEDMSDELLEQMAEQLPHLTGMMQSIAHDADSTLGWCDDQSEFEFGVDALLTGLESARRRA